MLKKCFIKMKKILNYENDNRKPKNKIKLVCPSKIDILVQKVKIVPKMVLVYYSCLFISLLFFIGLTIYSISILNWNILISAAIPIAAWIFSSAQLLQQEKERLITLFDRRIKFFQDLLHIVTYFQDRNMENMIKDSQIEQFYAESLSQFHKFKELYQSSSFLFDEKLKDNLRDINSAVTFMNESLSRLHSATKNKQGKFQYIDASSDILSFSEASRNLKHYSLILENFFKPYLALS